MKHWTLEKVDEALNRSDMAESVELPIEQFRELLIMAEDILKLAKDAKEYEGKYGIDTNYSTFSEYVELVKTTLDNY